MFDLDNNKKKILHYATGILLLLIVFSSGFFIGKNQVACQVCKPESVDFSLFWDAYNKLQESFIDPSKIDDQKIIYGAISGMAKSLGDPYTDFFDPKQANAFKQDLSGSFDGIGVEVGIKKEQLIVIAPLKGTPGEKAGLQAGDQIVQINGKSTFDISVDEAVNTIRGKKGTKVTLTIFREGWTNTKDIEIIRDTIKINSVEWELKEGDVAYIRISHFDQALSLDFKKVAREILQGPAKKIVLDLRNNPGGYLEVSQEITGWFVKNGDIVTIEDFGAGKEKREYRAEGNAALIDYPIVVLINKGSASAAEILAGALKDNRGVQLIGEKSFGKGSVQEVITLQDGASFLKVTIAKWLTPKGASISEVGLSPDVKVEAAGSDAKPGEDPQLQKALEIIKGLQ
ncbi:MAG: S41 family peptidase [bacterium]|nr:S41 family peptidase [bacterium]